GAVPEAVAVRPGLVPGLEVAEQSLAQRPRLEVLAGQVARWWASQLFFAGDPPDTVRSAISVDEDSARPCHAVSVPATARAACWGPPVGIGVTVAATLKFTACPNPWPSPGGRASRPGRPALRIAAPSPRARRPPRPRAVRVPTRA